MWNDIKVLKLIPLNGAGNLKAFATVKVGSLTIHGFRIVQQPGQRAWVAPPQREVHVAGKTKYYPMLTLPAELKEQIQAAVLRAWQQAAAAKRPV